MPSAWDGVFKTYHTVEKEITTQDGNAPRVQKVQIERPESKPTTQMLQALCERPDFADEPPDAQDRLRATTELMDQLNRWSDEMLRLSPGTLIKVLSLGASIQKFVRG